MKFTRPLIVVLSFALAISLVNTILYWQGESYYRQLNAARLDPLNLKFFPVSVDILHINADGYAALNVERITVLKGPGDTH